MHHLLITFWRLLCYRRQRDDRHCSGKTRMYKPAGMKKGPREDDREDGSSKEKERRSERGEKKGRTERSFEVAAGSFTFRNEIGVPPSLLDLFLSLSFFIPRYRMLRIFLAAANTVPPLSSSSAKDHLFDTPISTSYKLIRQILLSDIIFRMFLPLFRAIINSSKLIN